MHQQEDFGGNSGGNFGGNSGGGFGGWLIAHGWSEANWGGEMPDFSWLEAAGDRPVVCYRTDLHAVLVNEVVLKRCDFSSLSSDDRDRLIVRHSETGEITGLLLEAAAWEVVNPLIPSPSPAEKRQHLTVAMKYLNQFGVTTVGAMEYRKDVEEAFVPQRNDFTVRLATTLLDRKYPLEEELLNFARGFPNDDFLCIIGFKAFLDGTLGSRTARLLEDYADDPGNCGVWVELAASGNLEKWAKQVAEAGLSPSMHAIGDGAVRLALDIAEGLDPGCVLRMEHAQQVHGDDLGRFRDFRGVTSMQPMHRAEDGDFAAARLGEDRVHRGFFPFRGLMNHGATLAFGSDWPVVSPDPMLGMQAAITGRTSEGAFINAHENITPREALVAYTMHAARGLGIDRAGQLRPGYFGDLVVYDRDPLTADWKNQPPQVIMTVVGGQVVYDGR